MSHFTFLIYTMIDMELSNSALIRSSVLLALLSFGAFAEAGTFTVVQTDISQVSYSDSHCHISSPSPLEVDTSIYYSGTVYGVNHPGVGDSFVNNGAILGNITVTIRWSRSYPNEPVPTQVPVVWTVTGHEYIQGGSEAAFTPPTTVFFQSRLGDPFVSWESHVALLGLSYNTGSQTDHILGSVNTGTSAFTMASDGTFQATSLLSINLMAAAQASVAPYGLGGATSDLVNRYKITKIGTQTIS